MVFLASSVLKVVVELVPWHAELRVEMRDQGRKGLAVFLVRDERFHEACGAVDLLLPVISQPGM